LSQLQLIIVIGIVFTLFVGYVRLAKRDAPPQTLKGFFLGGAKIGPELTEANTLGITFAWSGGIWYFAWLAYQFGPIVLLSQTFWVFSLIILAILLPRILPHVRNRTLHGFLGEAFGVGTQRIAAVATTAGYVLNCGFEVFWSSQLFASSVGQAELALPTACMLALVVAAYCSIGGYKSSAAIDKPQNLLGVFALGLFVFLVSRSVDAPQGIEDLSKVFLAGAAAYCIISLLVYAKIISATKRLLDVVAICFAVAAVAISVSLFLNPGSFSHTESYAVSYQGIATWVLVSTISFQIFFNIVDMQNWQQIAANGDLPTKDRLGVIWSIVRGSLYLFWFPALGGVLLGCLLKASADGLNDATIFPAAADLVMPGSDGVLRALILGLLFAGLLSSALSTADSLLMSSIQTIFYDIKERRVVQGLLESGGDEEAERSLVRRAKLWLIPLAIAMVLVFYGLYYAYEGDVFLFQGLMYAMPLTLFAPVIAGLWCGSERLRAMRGFVFWGIAVGLAFVGAMAAVAFFVKSAQNSHIIGAALGLVGSDKEWLMALTPVVSNACVLLFVGAGLIFAPKRAKA
jgi:Na+/proline symporter